MPDEQRVAKPGKGNRNARVSLSKGKADRHIAWDDDVAILARVTSLGKLLTRGYRGQDLLGLLNAAEFQAGRPPISRQTMNEDRQRFIELLKREQKYTQEEAVSTLLLIQSEALRVWYDKSEPSNVRSQALREGREAVMALAAITGLIDSKGNVTVNVGIQEQKIEFVRDSQELQAALLILGMGEQPKLLEGEVVDVEDEDGDG